MINLINQLSLNKELPKRELESYSLEYKLPTTGFRNGKPIPCILFRFYTLNAFYRYKYELERKYPAPTEYDIKKGIYKNDIMVCEGKIPNDIKFCNFYSLQFGGWIKLSAGTFTTWDGGKRAIHNFQTMCVEGISNKNELADSLIDSFDIEAIRYDGAEAMPDATNPLDYTACIGHAIESTSRSFPRMYYLFTWGGAVQFPETDRKGKPLPKRKVILKIYKDEASMLTHWVRWRRSQNISPDCTIGWNIYGFDLGFLATRIRILSGIDEDIKEWGRLCGYETKIKDSNIESKAIAYNNYQLTPSPGNIFVDSLIIFQRDVTLRLSDYQLKTVSKHFLKEEKEDVHYSEIKSLFFGSALERGLLMVYNLKDVDLVLNLFFKCAHWPKMTNVCRVNRVPMNVLCPRGQQIRVFGGFHKNAMDDGYIIYRPHYDPILDEPIIEDPSLWTEEGLREEEKAENRFEKKSDIDSMVDYWNKKLNLSTFKPILSMITVDQNGKISQEKIIHSDTKPIPIDTKNNIKIYGKDVNPFQTELKKQTQNNGFFGRNGKTVEEIEKLSRVRRKRKFIPTEKGTMKVVPIIGKNKKKGEIGKDESEKGFAGGFVMEPKPGFYENIPIYDFNALYPNIMMSYCLDPALLVLDKRFANCPGVTYLRIRFNKNKEFLFAQGFPGVMIKHTRNLVNNRKIAQGIQTTYESRVEYCRKRLVYLLSLPVDTKTDDVFKKANEIVNKNDKTSSHIPIESYQNFYNEEIGVFKQVLIANGIFKDKQEYTIDQILNESGNQYKLTKNEKLLQSLEICFKIKNGYEEKIAFLKENINSESIILSILQILTSYDSEIANYNSKQNELKVGSNSTFGFLGAGGKVHYDVIDKKIIHKAMMQVMPISACVTYIGRKTIETAKEWVEKTYPGSKVMTGNSNEEGTRVIYADSVTGDTPLLCLLPDGLMVYRTIEQLSDNQWTSFHETKEESQPYLKGIKVWSDTGFTNIKRIIRHSCEKRIVRVVTGSGCVDVTEDHSLLNQDGHVVKPKECKIGDLLLHKDLPQPEEIDLDLHPETAWALGLFFAAGKITESKEMCIDSISWKIDNPDILNRAKIGLENFFPTIFSNLFYEKIIPDEILNASQIIRKNFIDGYIVGKDDFKLENKIAYAGLYWLFSSLGYGNQNNAIEEIYEIPHVDIVYDLQTDNHHFSAGIGRIVVHNTDSLFVLLPESIIPKGIEGLNKTFEISSSIADGITKLFAFPGSTMKIVHEKTARFLIIYCPKCYALDKYLKPYPEDVGKLEIKGVGWSKRDCCKLVYNICKSALDKILKQGKLEEAKLDVQERLLDLVYDRMRGDEIKLAKSKLSELIEPMVQEDHFEILKDVIADLEIQSVEYIDSISHKLIVQLKNHFKPTQLMELEQKLNEILLDKVKYEKLKIYKKLSKKTYTSKTEIQNQNSDKLMSFIIPKESKSETLKEELPSGITAHAQLAYRINQRKPGLGPKSGESVQ